MFYYYYYSQTIRFLVEKTLYDTCKCIWRSHFFDILSPFFTDACCAPHPTDAEMVLEVAKNIFFIQTLQKLYRDHSQILTFLDHHAYQQTQYLVFLWLLMTHIGMFLNQTTNTDLLSNIQELMQNNTYSLTYTMCITVVYNTIFQITWF